MKRYLFSIIFCVFSAASGSAQTLTDGQQPSLAPMIEKVLPAVVSIAVQGEVATEENPLLNDPFFRKFFNVPEDAQPPKQEFHAAGSG
ncbi:MAG: serine endoprotease DegQ, partial [Hoeflea sp.]|nr:serine endoprotease DegQ [Hoeflea sp.]